MAFLPFFSSLKNPNLNFSLIFVAVKTIAFAYVIPKRIFYINFNNTLFIFTKTKRSIFKYTFNILLNINKITKYLYYLPLNSPSVTVVGK